MSVFHVFQIAQSITYNKKSKSQDKNFQKVACITLTSISWSHFWTAAEFSPLALTFNKNIEKLKTNASVKE